MRILHTADWHLGARLNRISRADDLRRNVRQIMEYCRGESVDVLLVAGDLFHKGCWSEDVCEAIDALKEDVGTFLRDGGTIVALTGNHDGETLCRTLQHALRLADPAEADHGGRWGRGRFHLATRPTFFRLADRSGHDVQFVLMPHPTPSRYLDDAVTRYASVEEKHRGMRSAFAELLGRIRDHKRFDPGCPSVLAAHLYFQGVRMPNGHEPGEGEQVVGRTADLGSGWAYVALGDVHRGQAVGGLGHVRYSGSIERMDFDERDDPKGVVLVEVGPEGRRGEPSVLPLEATPFFDVEIARPAEDLPRLRELYPDAERALVRCRVAWTAGIDDLDEVLREVRATFPRCYQCTTHAATSSGSNGTAAASSATQRGVRETVLDYVKAALSGDGDAEDVLAAAESLLAEVQP